MNKQSEITENYINALNNLKNVIPSDYTLKNELGYWVGSKVLDSADYGVPQHRKRIYIVRFKNTSTKCNSP